MGDTVELDTSRAAMSVFGFNAGERVRFTKSRDNQKVALVCGVDGNGMLWFRMASDPDGKEFKEEVKTVSCRSKFELVRQYGWVLLSDDDVMSPSSSAAPPAVAHVCGPQCMHNAEDDS